MRDCLRKSVSLSSAKMYRNVKMPKIRPPEDFADCFDLDSPEDDFGGSGGFFANAVYAKIRHQARR